MVAFTELASMACHSMASESQAVGNQKPPAWRQLLEIATLADPDPWRVQLRQALALGDRKNLEALAGFTSAEELLASRRGVDVPATRPVLVVEDGRKKIILS